MPMLPLSSSGTAATRGRAAAKRRKVPGLRLRKEAAAHKRASFGAAVKKYAGIVHSGVGDLSTREGFGD